jgi:hypothetical protein
MEQNQMSKFCIQLESMMLPDAIAAVVEAWYDAQNAGNMAKQNHGPYRPGEPIEIRDSAAPGSAWKRGWVFYKSCNVKIGICLAEKWNHELNKPDYLVKNGDRYYSGVFSDRGSGCTVKQPENIRRVVIQPWEKHQMEAANAF